MKYFKHNWDATKGVWKKNYNVVFDVESDGEGRLIGRSFYIWRGNEPRNWNEVLMQRIDSADKIWFENQHEWELFGEAEIPSPIVKQKRNRL